MRNPSDRLTSPAARDAALRRLRRIERSAVVLGVALTAGFAVLAHASTPPYQKHRAVAIAVPTAPRSTPSATDLAASARHRRHVRNARARARRRAAAANVRAPAAVATSPVQPSPTPPVQPPPSPPVQTRQAPVTTSGGS